MYSIKVINNKAKTNINNSSNISEKINITIIELSLFHSGPEFGTYSDSTCCLSLG